MMERQRKTWELRAMRVDGSVLTTCTLLEARLSCNPDGSLR